MPYLYETVGGLNHGFEGMRSFFLLIDDLNRVELTGLLFNFFRKFSIRPRFSV